jgi:hypothetical protein
MTKPPLANAPLLLLLTQGFSLPQRGPLGFAPQARGLSNEVLLSLLHTTLYPLPRQFLTKVPVGSGLIISNRWWGWVAEIPGRIAGCAHPLEISASIFKVTSIHRLVGKRPTCVRCVEHLLCRYYSV